MVPELRQILTKNGARPVGAKQMLAQLVAEKLTDEDFDAFAHERAGLGGGRGARGGGLLR